MSDARKTIGGVVLLGICALFACASGSSCLFPVKLNGKYGFITKSGKVAIHPQFNDVGKFAEGLAPVKLGKSWGYIDRQGKLAIPPQFDVADPFSDGAALIGAAYRFGYIE
jgi:hypothetical protein